MSALTRFFAGLAIKRLLGERRGPVPPAGARVAAGATPVEDESPPPRGGLLVLMLAAAVAGVVLMVAFEAPVTRVLGVLSLFTFIVSGVFLIADPAFLGAGEEAEHRGTRAD